jgi:hypothetical protein
LETLLFSTGPGSLFDRAIPAFERQMGAKDELFVENHGGTYYIHGLPACSVL